MKRDFGGVIWTNHALARLRERGISQGDAWLAFNKPDKPNHATSRGAWNFSKIINGWKIAVVAKKNEKGEWVIMSVWSKPVFWQKEYRKVKARSWWSRLLRQIFLGDYR